MQEAVIVELLHSANDIFGDVQSISGGELRRIEEGVTDAASVVSNELHRQTKVFAGIECSPELGEVGAVGEQLVNESLLRWPGPSLLHFVDHLAGRGVVFRSHGLLDGERCVGLGVARHEDTPIAASADFIQGVKVLWKEWDKIWQVSGGISSLMLFD